MSVFISHSRRDVELVNLVRASLPLAGPQIIVYEDLPPTLSEGSPDAKRIKELIRDCKAVLLFHTPNVEASEFTKAWVHYEVSQASAHDKNLVVFQLDRNPPKMPITYFTDLAPLDPSRPESVPNMQRIAKNHGLSPVRESPLARAAIGGATGTVLGPLGMLAGAFIGLMTTPKKAIDGVPTLRCTSCKATFRFWSPKGTTLHCPSCLKSTRFDA